MTIDKCRTCKYCKVYYIGTDSRPAFSDKKCGLAWKLCKDVEQAECHHEKKAK